MLPPACQAGGRKRATSEPISGSCGANEPANTATSAMPVKISVGSSGNPSRRKAMRGLSSIAGVSIAMASLLQSDAWIDQGIKDVDQQVHHHDHGAAEQHDGLHHGKVAKGDALVKQSTDAGPGEHGFHHHGNV